MQLLRILRIFYFLLIIILVAGCCLVSGCWDRSVPQTPNQLPPINSQNSQTNSDPVPIQTPEVSGVTNTTTTSQLPVTDQSPPTVNHPPQPPANQTPQQLLEKTVAVYKSASSYSDHGEVRIIGKMTDPNTQPAPWFCTVAFQSPNKLRLEINDGKLVSDGEDCFAQIRPLPNQVLRFPTPQYWSIDVLFRDMFLDQAMDVGLPDTILRFPPQLILLFAESPLKTLLPEGAKTEFLDPQWINDTLCDVIRIVHPEGNRLLWISRTNHALLRFDYYVEGLPVPQGIESIQLIRIDLSDAQFNYDIVPEAFQMQQPQDARIVSEFQPVEIISSAEKKPENPLAVLSRMREEHRKELLLMFEKDYYATLSSESNLLQDKESAQADSPKSPETFTLKEIWKQPLTGAGNIAVITTDSNTRLFVPCEGNSLAVFDLSGKLLQKLKPEGLHNDELLTLIRTGTDGTGKHFIGISSIGGSAVHIFDDLLRPVFSYSPDTVEGVKWGVADFRFTNLHGNNNSPAMIVSAIALDGKDSVCAIDWQGKELWKDDSVTSPFQVGLFQIGNNYEILCLEVQKQQSLLLVYDLQGKRLNQPTPEKERQILWFNVADINGDGQSEIGVLYADENEKDFRFAIWNRKGGFLWNRPLPNGEYQKSIEQIITGDIYGDAIQEWILPTPNGMVFIFDRNGNTLDSFSFGKFLTGLAVADSDKNKRILITADNEFVTAFIVEQPVTLRE
jgi:outer membrane lipoprotein-sorting protein